jgi:hypothetical protein
MMLRIAEKHTRNERRTKRYKNRTGMLLRRTQSGMDSMDPNDAQVRMSMGMHYAQFIVDRGFSDHDLHVAAAIEDMDALMEGLFRAVERDA